MDNAQEFKTPMSHQKVTGFGYVQVDDKGEYVYPKKKFNLEERLIAVKLFPKGTSRGGVIIPEISSNVYTPRALVINVSTKAEYGYKVGEVVLLYERSLCERVWHDGDEMWVFDERSALGREIPEEISSTQKT